MLIQINLAMTGVVELLQSPKPCPPVASSSVDQSMIQSFVQALPTPQSALVGELASEAIPCTVPKPITELPLAPWANYLQMMLNVVISPNSHYLGACAAWQAYIAPDFVCVPAGSQVITRYEVVLAEWRVAMQHGHFSSVMLSDAGVRNLGNGYEEYQVTLVRRYAGHAGQDLLRDMLRLQILGRFCGQGSFQVLRHIYSQMPPKHVNGVIAQSQISQDLWVLSKFQGKLQGPGFFLEIGANHSHTLSNTYLLETAAGWHGVCVEPFPQGDWSSRQANLVQAAIGPEGGLLRFIAPGHVLGGLVDQVDLPRVLTSVPPEQCQIVEIGTRSIVSILQQAGHCGNGTKNIIHFLSLDSEGSEYDILSNFPFGNYTVLTAAVEHNFKEPARTLIRQLLLSNGFILDMAVEHDDFYVLADYFAPS